MKRTNANSDAVAEAEGAAKRRRQGGEESAEEELKCAICFEGPEKKEGRGQMLHQCSTCSPNAWHVCEQCNEQLLSRTCPLCKQHYAPRVLYALKGRPLRDALDPAVDKQEKLLLTWKIQFLEKSIPTVNTMCWIPAAAVGTVTTTNTTTSTTTTTTSTSTTTSALTTAAPEASRRLSVSYAAVDESSSKSSKGTAIFCLPKDEGVIIVKLKLDPQTFVDSGRGSKSNNARDIAISSGVDTDAADTSKFLFNNSTWDLIERSVEGGSVEDSEELSGAEGARKMIKICVKEGGALFLPIEPSTWADIEQSWREKLGAC